MYTNQPLFCWISFDNRDGASIFSGYRLIFGDLPIILGLVVTLVMYVGAIKRIKNLPEQLTGQMNLHVKKLFWYPLVLFGAVVPSLVDNLVAEYNPNRPSWMVAAHFVLTHSIGVTNAIVYGIQKRNQTNPKIEFRPTVLTASLLSESFEYDSY